MMVSALTIAVLAVLFVFLTAAWGVVLKVGVRHQIARLPRLYILFSLFRVLTVLLVAGIYILFVSRSVAESKSFAVVLFVMYMACLAMTLCVTLRIKNRMK